MKLCLSTKFIEHTDKLQKDEFRFLPLPVRQNSKGKMDEVYDFVPLSFSLDVEVSKRKR